MTLVWKTESGTLIQTQVGTIDVLNTYSAARTVYGWMGGADGAKFLLSKIPNPLSRRIKELKLDQNLRLMPFKGHVLTCHGPLVAHIDNAQDSFGGDTRTQVIGTTICALAHECEAVTAVRLFCRFLLPYLFGEANALIDALQGQLMEKTNLRNIINEGASRGLNSLFIDTLERLDIPNSNQGWRRTMQGKQDRDTDFLGEVNMIGGLLRWVAEEKTCEYRTRSACVARVAAYLRAIGYQIGSIQHWSGQGQPPCPIGPKSLVLVLGGSSETDPLMEEFRQLPDTPLILHYQFCTTGAMLLTALQHAPDIQPEVLQTDFEQVSEYVEQHLTIGFTCSEKGVSAVYNWKEAAKAPISLAVRLATMYFPDTAEYLAPCYDRIAKPEYLECIQRKSAAQMKPKRKELARFRAITASIVISVITRFTPHTFNKVQHATLMDLSEQYWLQSTCKTLDSREDLPVNSVVRLLASVHAAHDFEHTNETRSKLVAWRNGIYGIFPSLLLTMQVSPVDLEFICIDGFWANVKVREDGSVRSSSTPDVQRHEIDIGVSYNNPGVSALQSLDEPNVGPPQRSPPDGFLYLSPGSPLHNGEPDLCLVAWIDGSVAGTVGVLDVLKAVLLSRVEPDLCPGHDGAVQVVNTKTSHWMRDPFSKPLSRHYPMYISASGDHCWAMFVAGQTVDQGGRIVFRCAGCSIQNYQTQHVTASGSEPPGIFVGFG